MLVLKFQKCFVQLFSQWRNYTFSTLEHTFLSVLIIYLYIIKDRGRRPDYSKFP